MNISQHELLQLLQQPAPLPLTQEIAQFHARPKTQYALVQQALLEKRAQEYLCAPIPALTFAQFAAYEASGDRIAYQWPYYERRGRLLTFSLLVFFHPTNTQYLHALEETLWAICAEPVWCLPAHFLGPRDAPLALDEYETHLDLFACETANAIAEALRLTETLLPPVLVALAKQQVWRRCLLPFAQLDHPYRFEQMKNNWSGVCGAALGMTALYLVEDTTLLAQLLQRCIACTECYLGSFGADGICTEGVSYWSYGFGFFTCFAQMLAQRTGGACDYFKEEKVKAIAATGSAFYMGGCATVAFSDGSEDEQYRKGLACFLHQRTGAPVPPANCAADCLADRCYRYCLATRDFFWACDEAPPQADPDTQWYPDAQWLLSRGNVLSLAAKAGHKGESQNHNDVGTFSLYQNGEAVVCDLGAGLYDGDYFSTRRYHALVNRSRSHNVPLLHGAEQAAGATHAATQVVVETTQDGCLLALQMSEAYPAGSAASLHRTLSFTHSTASLQLCDSVVYQTQGTLTEVFCAKEPILLQENGALFTRNGQTILLSYPADAFTAQVQAETYMGHKNTKENAWFLHLTAKPFVGTFTANLVFQTV